MSRNFGLGSRCMKAAARFALKEMASFSSRDSVSDRWNLFVDWLHETTSVRRMEHITRDHVLAYGKELASFVVAGTMSASTAQNRVSAVNTVMYLARRKRLLYVSPTRDCEIRKRIRKAIRDDSMPRHVYESLILDERIQERMRAIVALQWNWGLRMEEAIKLDAKTALRQAQERREIEIRAGTKGGRPRRVPVTSEEQVEALKWAASIQDGRSMIPRALTYDVYRKKCLRVNAHRGIKSHSCRHAYANRRYLELLGCPSPVASGKKKEKRKYYEYVAATLGVTVEDARERVRKVSLQVAEELGHSREDITSEYCG